MRAREGFLRVYEYEGFVQPFFLSFLAALLTCRVLVPRPEIHPASSAVGAQSLNRWTAGEIPVTVLLSSVANVMA